MFKIIGCYKLVSRIKFTKIFILLFIIFFLISCQINKQIFGQNQGKPDFFITQLRFEDDSIEKVYVHFRLHNNIDETAYCSVKISFYKNEKLISDREYLVGDIERNSVKKNKILVDMSIGKTKVNLVPLCEKKEKEKKIEQKDVDNGFFIEDLELKESSIKKGLLIFKLKNILDETANCSAKVIMMKDDRIISEDIHYIGYINGNSEKSNEILIDVPLRQTIIDVKPLCSIKD